MGGLWCHNADRTALPYCVWAWPTRTPFQCLVDPCESMTSCSLGCASDYCGGCFARCQCSTDADCEESGGGVCRPRLKPTDPLGTCSDRAVPIQPRCEEGKVEACRRQICVISSSWCTDELTWLFVALCLTRFSRILSRRYHLCRW